MSVFGDQRGKEVAIAGLKAKAKYIRSQLGKRMRLRLTPQLRFIEDDSIERGCRVCRTIAIFGYIALFTFVYISEKGSISEPTIKSI